MGTAGDRIIAMHFVNRREAGKRLAEALRTYRGGKTVVYALPRGGVPVGFEVAKELGAPLDLIISRKIGHPHYPEYAVCAVTEDGDLVCDEAERASLEPAWLEGAVEHGRAEAKRRREVYLAGRKHISARGRKAIVVDDGIATGLTMRAALQSLRKEHPKQLVAAVPVAPHDVVETLRSEADAVVVLEGAEHYLGAVGAYYDDFSQVTDGEVAKLLGRTPSA